MKKSQPIPKSKNTESQMREKWESMGKELDFKKDSTTLKNALKDYRSVEIMYPKMGGRPDIMSMANNPFSSDIRERHASKSGTRAMKASIDFDKVANKRRGDKEFYDKMKLKSGLRKKLE
jgi:hypothetical protein